MSTSHHSKQEQEAAERFMNEVFGQAKQAYPEGRLNAHDEGEFAYAIAVDRENKRVIMQFPTLTSWIGLTAGDARTLANKLLELEKQL